MTQTKVEAATTELTEAAHEIQRLAAKVSAQERELGLQRMQFARYETALRGSQVVLYTQDRDLRYTAISNPMAGHSIEQILGRTDEQILPPDSTAAIVGLKREVLATGQPRRGEVSLNDGTHLRWHDLHIEPLNNESGEVIGLTCAAIDITDRKEGEAHLRLLMRELTHRSKNLLAVIQAMARQTARHAGSTDAFLEQFAARLQALAASHDLLVRESWYGASLSELIQSQLNAYTTNREAQVAMEGPPAALKPEAAQNLGLALHELAVNAAQFGSLSVPNGRVTINWALRDGVLTLQWREQSGPQVKPRRKKGFGSMVIERNLSRALDAKVDMHFDPDGLLCRIEIPASQVLAPR